MKIQFKSSLRPSLVQFDNGLYVVGGSNSMKVPQNTSIQDIQWIPLDEFKAQSIEVKGSKGNIYVVRKTSNGLTCTCTGFKFNKKCKHLTEWKD